MQYRAVMAVTTLRHPFAALVYAGIGVLLGAVIVVRPETAPAMTQSVGPVFASAWAMWITVGGLMGLAAIVGFGRPLRARLAMEAFGAASMAAALALYVASLLRFYPADQAVQSKVLWTLIALCCALRARQALRDRHGLVEAEAAGLPANPSPLGDPKGDSP